MSSQFDKEERAVLPTEFFNFASKIGFQKGDIKLMVLCVNFGTNWTKRKEL